MSGPVLQDVSPGEGETQWSREPEGDTMGTRPGGEMADTADLKSADLNRSCRFESGPGHQNKGLSDY